MNPPRLVALITALACSAFGFLVTAPAARAAEVVATIAVGSSPWDIVLTADGSRAYVTNFADDTVSVINTSTATVASTIAVGDGPKALVITPDSTKVIVANINSGTYSVIRTSDDTVTTTVSQIGLCTHPNALSIHPTAPTIYISCGANGRMFTMNTASYATASLVNGSPAVNASHVSPDASDLVFVDTAGNQAYYVNVSWTPSLGHSPVAITSNYDGSLYFTANTDGTFTSLRYAGAVITSTSVGTSLSDIAMNSGDTMLYATDSGADALLSIDPTTGSARVISATGSAPRAFAMNADTTRFYVVNGNGNSVSVISNVARAYGDAPTAALQAFGLAPELDCAAFAPEHVDWPALAGMRALGWYRSWAQWVNENQGGWVCERQPYFTTAQAWSVQ